MNTLLQLTDAITGRRCAVRVDPEEAALPLSGLLDRYVKHFPARLLEEGRVTVESSETLLGFQDLVYACSDSGALLDLYPGVELVQHGKPLALDRPPVPQAGRVGGVDVTVLDIGIDRTDAGYDRNWTGFHRRRWDRHADLYERFVRDALLACHSESEEILALESSTAKMALVEALARRVWKSNFESYSRFVGGRLPYKTGDETVRGIVAGDGGVCSEKVQALKCLITSRIQLPTPPGPHRCLPLHFQLPILRPLIDALIPCITPHPFLSTVQQTVRLRHVMHVRRCRSHAMNNSRLSVRSYVYLHPKMPLIPLLRLTHLRVSLT